MKTVLLKEIAYILKKSEKDVERESLGTFLDITLKKLLAEQLVILKKYGIKNVDEMEHFYREKKIEEKDTMDDFFELTHIESEVNSIKQAMEKLK